MEYKTMNLHKQMKIITIRNIDRTKKGNTNISAVMMILRPNNESNVVAFQMLSWAQ